MKVTPKDELRKRLAIKDARINELEAGLGGVVEAGEKLWIEAAGNAVEALQLELDQARARIAELEQNAPGMAVRAWVQRKDAPEPVGEDVLVAMPKEHLIEFIAFVAGSEKFSAAAKLFAPKVLLGTDKMSERQKMWVRALIAQSVAEGFKPNGVLV